MRSSSSPSSSPDEYQKIHPDIKIEISAGGAGKGMTDALTGMVKFSYLGSAALVLVVGAVLAGGLGRDLPPSMAIVRPLHHASIPVGRMFVGIDGVLRRWPVAGLAVLAAAIAFGAAMLVRG